MTSTRVVLQTPGSLLEHTKNDYSDLARNFEQLGGVFIDFGEDDLSVIATDERDRIKIEKNALRQKFLKHERHVPFLTIIVNVAGRPRAFTDVLQSLAAQSFIERWPEHVEILLIQDGPGGVLDEEVRDNVNKALANLPHATTLRAFRLGGANAKQGRATARNVGIWHSCPRAKVFLFLDDAMILDRDFVTEHMLRHTYTTAPMALLGFKQNCKFGDFCAYRSELNSLKLKRPNFEDDWKWWHELKEDEATPPFEYSGQHFAPGSIIQYMKITNNLRDLRGNQPIGKRWLPMFFQTGLTSVSASQVREVGGFEEIFDVDVWGFEDSYLGLLLAAKGVMLVPCPSSLAYKIEFDDEERMERKDLQIEYHRKTFWDCANIREWKSYNEGKLKEQFEDLESQNLVENIVLRVVPGPRSFTERPMAKPSIDADVGRLPDTYYKHLFGRKSALERLDGAWTDTKTSILSLVAEGGMGKSALINEWLTRLRDENYRGAEVVLGWSCYSQGSKERAISTDEFLNWAVDRLGINLGVASANAKGEAIAVAMMHRRVLLILDGIEPLQHGPGSQFGRLKDEGLRALLRRFVATPPNEAHGLIVLSSRVAVTDISRWKKSAAPVIEVERLSDEDGAALLRDYDVWGTDKEMKTAVDEFGGHPLALGLLASFLNETQNGDVRRRDLIRNLLTDTDNPGHEHARRVLESLEKEWLAEQPVLLTIMHMVGLFDRPVAGDCLAVLRENPPIAGFSEALADLNREGWNRAITRLRETRLLVPQDALNPQAVDAHPLVREWFGDRFRQGYKGGWRAAHGRVYEHLRETTMEGDQPSLADLGPLYQAIRHGCLAGRHPEALNDIYRDRISRRLRSSGLEYYAMRKLGAVATELAAISWFFEKPYETMVATLSKADQILVGRLAADCLKAQGRFADALPIHYQQLHSTKAKHIGKLLARIAKIELLVGHVSKASEIATRLRKIVEPFANRATYKGAVALYYETQADILYAEGKTSEAKHVYMERERRKRAWRSKPDNTLFSTYMFCDLLLAEGSYRVASDRASAALARAKLGNLLLDVGRYTLVLGRANIGLIETSAERVVDRTPDSLLTHASFDGAVNSLRAAGDITETPRGLLVRAVFRRSIGDWEGATRDLDEVEEIAEAGPMRLFLCDAALNRVRLAFARIEAFAPLNGLLEWDKTPKPSVPSVDAISELRSEAEKQFRYAADNVEKCFYAQRIDEVAELRAVLDGEKKFSDLPARV